MPLFRRARETTPGAQAYESLLERLAGAAEAETVLGALPGAAAASGLSQKQLTELNHDAFHRYAEQALARETLTNNEYIAFDQAATALGVEISDELTARTLIAVINGGLLIAIAPAAVMPEPGEAVYSEVGPVTLMKELRQRDFSGGYGGVSFRVAKGVRVSTGRFGGHSVQTHTKLTPVDTGNLAVTSRRTIFTGSRTTLAMPHDKLVGLNIYDDGLLFHASNRQTPVLLTGFRGELVAAYINAAAQRQLARQATGGSDDALADIAHRLDAAMTGPGFDFERFVLEEATRTGIPQETVRSYLGTYAQKRAKELQEQVQALEAPPSDRDF